MELIDVIEQKRREMEVLTLEKGLGAPEVLKVSEELDQLLNQYQKVSQSAC